MSKQCSHNWQQQANKEYCQCLICGQEYNVERLLNELQGKVEQQEQQIKEQSESSALWMEIAIRHKNITEWQSDQIFKMKNCGNCVKVGSNRHGVNNRKICEDNDCENKINWEWDGGSGDNL